MISLEESLEPGEAVIVRKRGVPLLFSTLYALLGAAFLFLVIALLIQESDRAATVFLQLKGYVYQFGVIVFIGAVAGCAQGVLVTDRRVLCCGAVNHRRIYTVGKADIVSVRQRLGRVFLMVRAPGDIRCLTPQGVAVPIPGTFLELNMRRAIREEYRTRATEREAFLNIFGHEPKFWRQPEWPADVDRLRALFWIVTGVAVIGWIALSWMILALAMAASDMAAIPGGTFAFVIALAAPVLAALWLILKGACIVTLLAARIWLPAEQARLYLFIAHHPDWRGEILKSGEGWQRRLTRDEAFLSRLYDRPIRCKDAPGPEAFGGGWVQ